MAIERRPAFPYTLAQWQSQPYNRRPDVEYEKFRYGEGDSLASIAALVSRPWRSITWQDIAMLNWNTAVPAEINWYLKNLNGCTRETADGLYYILSSTDANPWFWVPVLKRETPERFRSPGRQDVGHVALDDGSGRHINTLVVRPAYSISIELGDIDALFDPMDGPGSPWNRPGVRQRLQALGYLYTPLDHAKIADHARKVWEHYLKIHQRPGEPPLTSAQAKARLRQEIQNNLLCIPSEPPPTRKGQIDVGRLPQPGEFAMIRFPGGYCYNDGSHRFRDLDDSRYRFQLSADRHRIEEAVFKANPLMGKFPLVATVKRIRPDGTVEPARGVTVYFQLVPPDPWPEDAAAEARKQAAMKAAEDAARALAANPEDPALVAQNAQAQQNLANALAAPPPEPSHPLRAPHLLDKQMDYSKNWQKTPARPAGLTDAQWNWVRHKARTALRIEDAAAREAWIVANVDAPWRDRVREAVNGATPADPGPYTIDGGPRKFVDDTWAAFPPVDPDDPQKDNCDKQFHGKRGIPVAGEGSGSSFRPGVFEVEVSRVGLHSRRDSQHADYGSMEPARKVEPTIETDDSGAQVKRHNHAVRAKTNDQGHACVIFCPSSIGGDRYRIRAYVGPETLEFDGTNPDGPVVTTGTMVVWRSIRLNRYIRIPVPPKAGVSQQVRDIFPYCPNADHNTLDKVWELGRFGTGMWNVDMSRGGRAEGPYAPNDKTKYNGTDNTHYRPLAVNFIGPAEQFRRLYCDFIIEPDTVPEVPTEAEMRAAFEAGLRAGRDSGVFTKDVDWSKLVFYDPTSPFLVNVCRHEHYNAKKNADPATRSKPNLVIGDMGQLYSFLADHFFDGMMKYLSGGAVLPGITVVYTPRGTTWDFIFPGDEPPTTSGVGLPQRGCFLWYPAGIYAPDMFPYSGTANTLHEMGHVLVRQHQPTVPNNGDAQTHEPQGTCTCIMSYRGCFGQFCGRCSLALRGLKTKSATTADGA